MSHQRLHSPFSVCLSLWGRGGVSMMPSCVTVDQVSWTHGLILGSGKPGLNQVWAVLNWEGVVFQVPRSAPAFVSFAQTSIWVNTIEKIAIRDNRCPIFGSVCIILTLICYLTGLGGVVINGLLYDKKNWIIILWNVNHITAQA